MRELGQADVVTSRSGRPQRLSSGPWFDVMRMSEHRYTLFHRPTGNWLEWFPTLDEAVKARDQWVAAAPEATPELEIWDDEKGVQIELDSDKSHPAPAA